MSPSRKLSETYPIGMPLNIPRKVSENFLEVFLDKNMEDQDFFERFFQTIPSNFFRNSFRYSFKNSSPCLLVFFKYFFSIVREICNTIPVIIFTGIRQEIFDGTGGAISKTILAWISARIPEGISQGSLKRTIGKKSEGISKWF